MLKWPVYSVSFYMTWFDRMCQVCTTKKVLIKKRKYQIILDSHSLCLLGLYSIDQCQLGNLPLLNISGTRTIDRAGSLRYQEQMAQYMPRLHNRKVKSAPSMFWIYLHAWPGVEFTKMSYLSFWQVPKKSAGPMSFPHVHWKKICLDCSLWAEAWMIQIDGTFPSDNHPYSFTCPTTILPVPDWRTVYNFHPCWHDFNFVSYFLIIMYYFPNSIINCVLLAFS